MDLQNLEPTFSATAGKILASGRIVKEIHFIDGKVVSSGQFIMKGDYIYIMGDDEEAIYPATSILKIKTR